MWDWVKSHLQGRLSLQTCLLVLSSVMIALFASVILSQSAAAADAERNTQNDTVKYQNHTYTRIEKNSLASDAKTKDLPITNYDGYKFEDNSTIYFILTESDAKTASEGQAVSYKLRDGVYDPSSQSSSTNISIADASSSSTGVSEDSNSDDDESSCKMDGVGWFVCPAMTFIADRMDNLMDLLRDFMTVKTFQVNTNDNPIYEIWQKVRDLSNICFVLVFLLIIYSQITNTGLTNYSLKQMLPRLVIGAILVNVSYWLAGACIDISNVLGVSVQQFFTDVRNGLSGYDQLGDDVSWIKVTGAVLAGGGTLGAVVIANGGIGASLTLLIPILVGVILAAVVAVIILAARQALITLCVIVAPLAFVGYVLPSTNKYFDKWKDIFLTMLLMFPIVSFLFGAAQLAGYAIIANAGDSLIQIIIGMAVQIAPVAVTPLIVKFSGGLLGRIAGVINNPNRGLIDRTRNWAQGRAAYQASKVRSGKNLINTDRGVFKKSSKLRKAANAINKSHGSRANLVNSAVRAHHRRSQRIKGLTSAYEAAAANNATEWDNNRHGKSSVQAVEGENEARKAEIGNNFYRAHHHLTQRQQLADIDKARAQNEFNETSAGQEIETARRTVEAHKQRITNDQQARWDTLAQTDSNHKALELEVKKSEFDAARAKEKLGKMHAEIIAQGDHSEHVMNLRGTESDTYSRERVLHIARDIKQANIETNLAGSAKRAAEQELASEINSIMLNNTVRVDNKPARQYAAGIGTEASALAASVTKARKEAGDRVAEQVQLSYHFKLDAAQIEALATGNLGTDADGNEIMSLDVADDKGRRWSFDKNDEYVREMAVDQIFDVGSYKQKKKIWLSTGIHTDENGNKIVGHNYDLRRTVNQAAIRTKFMEAGPMFADRSLKQQLNGDFTIHDLYYNSYREILEGKLKSGIVAKANADALQDLFSDINSAKMNKEQFERLINDNIAGELKKLRSNNPAASDADARHSLINKFNANREAMRRMAVEVLKTPTLRQLSSDEAVRVMKEFTKGIYDGD